MDSDSDSGLRTQAAFQRDSSSSIHTPPSVVYDNIAGPSHSKAKSLRREPSGLVDCHRVLTKVFGHADYKGKQREIVEAAVRGADIFVLAPTGMGKEFPAVADTHGITIVVSPLLALMKNQVSALRAKSVNAVALTSETDKEEKEEIVRDLSSGHPINRLLYITPEKLLRSEFLNTLDTVYENQELNRLVIDEAHCISEWGHDFRAEYRRLGIFRRRFNDVPIMALTATATPTVQADIIRSLEMSSDHLVKVVHPFNRSNLFYEVRYLGTPNQASQFADILNFILTIYERRERVSAGIIYCRTRAGCDELSTFLRGNGVKSKPYHRGLRPSQLDSTLREWTSGGGAGSGSVDVVCATIAFGLGIDKGDVRYIIHYDLPKSLEGYYQETGRAGRDGSAARCVLYYSREDAIRVKRLISANQTKRTTMALQSDGPEPSQRSVDSFRSLIDLAESTTLCRHVAICRYFGEAIDSSDAGMVRKYCNKMCDICKNPAKTKGLHQKLSSLEFAATQVPIHPSRTDLDDENVGSKNDNQNKGDIAAMKRARTEVDNAAVARYGKKSKTSGSALPMSMRSLNTRQFASHGALLKPYKPPLKAAPAPSIDENERPALEPDVESEQPNQPITIDLEDEDDLVPEWDGEQRNEKIPERLQFDDDMEDELRGNRESSPMELGKLSGEMEAYFSQKIPLYMRHSARESLRQALHKTFLRGDADKIWKENLGKRKLDAAYRSPLLDEAAKGLEFAAFSLCSTQDGYGSRVEATVDAVKFLAKHIGRWKDGGKEDEWEEAMEVIQVVKNAKL
ncbi:ATP-dependent DNA helicase [Mycena indigotica]|uniref:ATP-dependent DNA helicase n=1 Tax=Mycena indigotica TaxID=2126181 RepID=A0A8H6W1Y6_9AGAR|nr:ATP-dependent DNA helicase [Mycena indigotica]KAF7298698.1 ATP-dependent DNA helicase [Mycena indigotica]